MRIRGPSTSRATATVAARSSQLGVGHPRHRGVRLGPEVLHDDFLDAAVRAGDPADREQRLDPLREGLADADQDAGGERDRSTGRRPRAPAAGPPDPCPANRSARRAVLEQPPSTSSPASCPSTARPA